MKDQKLDMQDSHAKVIGLTDYSIDDASWSRKWYEIIFGREQTTQRPRDQSLVKQL